MSNNYVPSTKTALLTERELLVLILNALNGSGSGSGVGGALNGSGPPTTQVPAGGAGTYFDYTNSVLYNWNPITASWV